MKVVLRLEMSASRYSSDGQSGFQPNSWLWTLALLVSATDIDSAGPRKWVAGAIWRSASTSMRVVDKRPHRILPSFRPDCSCGFHVETLVVLHGYIEKTNKTAPLTYLSRNEE